MKSKKLFLSSLALALAIPAFAQSVSASTVTFKDVSKSHPNYEAITELAERKVINGYTDGTFRPNNQVNRAEFAAFVARSLDLPAADSNFKDVPKSAALYDGVSRAYKAGIIKGFSDGSFKPTVAVNRQDMAVMIDRAMQLKGSYTKTKALNFSDSAKVGAYAKTSVERLYNYNVMGAYSGTSFQPTTIGTRAETAKHIYNMLNAVGGGTGSEPTTPVAKHYFDMTLAELKKAYPEYDHVMIERQWKPEPKIVERDIMAYYYTLLHNPMFVDYPGYIDNYAPEKILPGLISGWKDGMAANYMDYPMVEIIAYNGKSYKDSYWMPDWFSERETEVYNQMPSQPSKAGQFLIDIHRYDNDLVWYRNEDVKWDTLLENPVVVGEDYIVDLFGTFKYATGVTMASGGLQIAYNGNKIVLTNGSNQATVNGAPVTLTQKVSVKSGRAFGTIREIAGHIGLHSKWIPSQKRLEITNFER